MHTHTHTHTRTHIRTHTHARTHMWTQFRSACEMIYIVSARAWNWLGLGEMAYIHVNAWYSLLLSAAVDLKNAPGAIYPGEPRGEKPGCTLTLSDQDFVGLVNGEVKAEQVCTGLHSGLHYVIHVLCTHYMIHVHVSIYTKLNGHQPRDPK